MYSAERGSIAIHHSNNIREILVELLVKILSSITIRGKHKYTLVTTVYLFYENVFQTFKLAVFYFACTELLIVFLHIVHKHVEQANILFKVAFEPFNILDVFQSDRILLAECHTRVFEVLVFKSVLVHNNIVNGCSTSSFKKSIHFI